MRKFKTGQVVKTTKKIKMTDPTVEPLFIKNRRNTEDSIIDSPVHYNYNKLWMVKHSNSCLVHGISIGYYAVYHEDELEIVDTPQVEEKDDDDFEFTDYESNLSY